VWTYPITEEQQKETRREIETRDQARSGSSQA